MRLPILIIININHQDQGLTLEYEVAEQSADKMTKYSIIDMSNSLSSTEAPYGKFFHQLNNVGFGRAHRERWHSPRATVFPSSQAYKQEAFLVKAAQKRPLQRREE